MSCFRCGGYLAIEPSIDFYNPEGQWRCINCGAHLPFHSSTSKALSRKPSRPTFKLSTGEISTPGPA